MRRVLTGVSVPLLSDNGAGAERIYQSASASLYARRERRAVEFVRRRFPHLLPTLRLILKNGSNRRESIYALMRRGRNRATAESYYYSTRRQLLEVFAF